MADAYYASRKVLRPLLAAGHQVLSRVRRNAVAYHPAPKPDQPRRGRLILMSTDRALTPLAIIAAYGYRFKIELAFKQALYTFGSYGYHLWMMAMTPRSRCSGNQYLHRTSADYRRLVRRKLQSYHMLLQTWHCPVNLGSVYKYLENRI